jgi:catechol 2,3-dioxygenase-like lactoylglutathione lyase family enzyme
MESLGYIGKLVCSISVSDHLRSSKWYVETLGFSVVFENAEYGMSYLATPVENVWLDLSQVEKPDVKGPALVWGVKSVDQARAELEAKGVRFDGATREFGGMVKLATFFDPDGNTLMLYENLG